MLARMLSNARASLVQYKMSLKGAGWANLGIAHSNARNRESEPGADAGFSGRQPGGALPCRGPADIYAWVDRTLRRQRYSQLGRETRGLVRRYVTKMTGLSRAQVTRLIGQFVKTKTVKPPVCRRHRFRRRYTTADVATLVEVDRYSSETIPVFG